MSAPLTAMALLAYTGLLFIIAWRADRRAAPVSIGAVPSVRSARLYPIIFGLSLAVYCTSWTFYGAVGTAVLRGWEYLPIYLGPALMFSIGLPLVIKLVRRGKEIHSTSIADFIAAHYNKSRGLAALVTLISVVGAIPYIALQLKSVATSFGYLTGAGPQTQIAGFGTVPVALLLAAFAIVFGTRHMDVTRSNRGMIAAIAFDSGIKLVALIVVAVFAVGMMNGMSLPEPTAHIAAPVAGMMFTGPIGIDRFITLTLLSMAAILCLPRQFHATVVECEASPVQTGGVVVKGGLVFLAYLGLISFLAIPIAQIGAAQFSNTSISPDLFVLALPLQQGQGWLALLVFVGGFAAAAGMVVVACVALSTMITNDLIAPFVLRLNKRTAADAAIGQRLLIIRRTSIAIILLVAAMFANYAPRGEYLASFGILSFAAAAQIIPALIAALYWKRASRMGAYLGLSSGFVIWFTCLFIPSFVFNHDMPLDIFALLNFTHWDSLTRGTVISLGINSTLLIGASLVSKRSTIHTRGLATAGGNSPVNVCAGDIQALLARCIGQDNATVSLSAFEKSRGRGFHADRPIDDELCAFAEQQISRTIGASSARILLGSLLARSALQPDDVATLLDETTGRVNFSRELLQTTLEHISVGVSVVDNALNIVAWNAAYLDMYQYPDGFVYVGQPVEDLIRYNARQGECGLGDLEDKVARRIYHLKQGNSHSFERTRPDGRVVKIEGVRSPNGAYVTTFTDISSYKQIEKALTDSERSIRFYTDNIPAMTAFMDGDGRLQFANRAYRTAFFLDNDDVLGKKLSDLISPADYALRKPFIDRALRGEKVAFDIDITFENTVAHMLVSYVPQFRDDGSVRGFFGLYQDLTARRQAEKALARTNETLEERVRERTQALSDINLALDVARKEAETATVSKTRFLAAASHDVLQPLNAARLFTAALMETPADATDQIDLVTKVDQSIASADSLLRALLDISKLDAGGIKPEFSRFPLNDLFHDIDTEFSLSAANKGLEFKIIPTSLWIQSDRGLFFSALSNIVSNAVRYTKNGRIVIGARRSGKHVRVEVYDTGPGIAKMQQHEIFIEFNRLSRDKNTEGVGLGLAMVERICRLLKSDLALRSQVGRGSVFSLTATRGEAQVPSVVNKVMNRPLEGLLIVCIDNEKSILDAMATLLKRWGGEVITATSQSHLIEQMGDHHACPDILLLDYQLDDGITGFDVFRSLTRQWEQRPVTIMITAASSGDASHEAAKFGIPVLRKPVQPASLRALIDQSRRRAADGY